MNVEVSSIAAIGNPIGAISSGVLMQSPLPELMKAAQLAEQELIAAERQARTDGLALNDTLQELVTLRSSIAARQAREQVDRATRAAQLGNRHQRRAHKHYK